MTTPRGAPELASAQALPETTVNEQNLRNEGGAGRFPIADRVTAPPGTCANRAQYIITATATGDFAGKEGQIAQAVGANAASGWLYIELTAIDEGVLAYVQDEDVEYQWDGSAWGAASGGSGYTPGGTDVAVADGGTGASTAAGARTNLGVDKRIVTAQLTGSALTASEVLAAFTPPDGETWTFAGDFAGSSYKKLTGATDPASSYAIDVSKNGSTVGTITISNAGAVTFATSGGSSFSLIGGTDAVRLVGNATPDTAVGFVFTLVATYA